VPQCDDAEFIRRAHLDLIGVLPSVDEVQAFLTSKAADKRAKLIDALLDRPEYVDYWSLKWSDLLRSIGATSVRRAWKASPDGFVARCARIAARCNGP